MTELKINTSLISLTVNGAQITGFLTGYIIPLLLRTTTCSKLIIFVITLYGASDQIYQLGISQNNIVVLRLIGGFSQAVAMTEISCQMYIVEVIDDSCGEDNDDVKNNTDAALETAKSLFINSTVSELGFASGSAYLAILQAQDQSVESGYYYLCAICIILFMLLLFIYTDKEMKVIDQNIMLEMTKMENSNISMYSLGQYQIISRNYNKLQSINFKENEFHKEDSMENVNINKSKKQICKAKTDIEMKLKSDQNNKVENVSIFHLITNYRFVMNCLQSLLTNSYFILVIQILVPYLTSDTFKMSLGEASLVMTAGTVAIITNALIMYIISQTELLKISDTIDQIYATSRDQTVDLNIKNNDYKSRNQLNLSDMYRKAPDTFNNTIGNSRMEIQSILENITNQNIETTNLSILKSVVPEHCITSLNTSIINYVNLQNKITEMKFEDSKNQKNKFEIKNLYTQKYEIAMHNILFIILGATMYTLSFLFFDPLIITNDVTFQRIIIIVSIMFTCLGQCNTFIHMSQEFNMAIIDIQEDKFQSESVKIETNILIEYGSSLQNQLWQIGTFIVPMIISILIDYYGVGTVMRFVGIINLIFVLLYIKVYTDLRSKSKNELE